MPFYCVRADGYVLEDGATLIDGGGGRNENSRKSVRGVEGFYLVADGNGCVKLDEVVRYFRNYYEARRRAGLVVEKANSLFAKDEYTDGEALKNILSNPFKRFEDMQMMRHTKTLGIIQVDESVWKQLSDDTKVEIERICDKKLAVYYSRLSK
jgi:hypothetical protein